MDANGCENRCGKCYFYKIDYCFNAFVYHGNCRYYINVDRVKMLSDCDTCKFLFKCKEPYVLDEPCKYYTPTSESSTPPSPPTSGSNILKPQNQEQKACKSKDRCVHYLINCTGQTRDCPPGLKYQRDPPDGGYYG